MTRKSEWHYVLECDECGDGYHCCLVYTRRAYHKPHVIEDMVSYCVDERSGEPQWKCIKTLEVTL
ncbi:MAG: hypothetical protein KAS32_02390 [Candidatus Peribacteraceae bacterium]|nr:hypothetical protein [Candidatus Peribacteraceae bacterium]